MNSFNDLTGQKFNMLTILRHIGKNKHNNHIYEAECDCGNKKVFEGSDIKTGKVQSCGCKRYLTQKREHTVYLNIFNDYRKKAEYRGYDFKLTKEEFYNLLDKNCHYCGSEPLSYSKKRYYHGDKTVFYNGVDRTNNELGYIIENVVSCCKICNQAKHQMSKPFFLEWIEKVYKFQKGIL